MDDGSTDSSGIVCDGFAKRDKRIRVIHKENGGVSSARNVALKHVKGEWIGFCDADDILYPDTLRILFSLIESDCDGSIGGYIMINPEGEVLERSKKVEKTQLTICDALKDFYTSRNMMFNGYLWNRLFNTKIIKDNHLSFREDIYIKEDGLFLVQYLCCCKGLISYTTKPIYKYVYHDSSAMNTLLDGIHKKSLSRLVATIECYKEVRALLDGELTKKSITHISYVYFELIGIKRKGLKGIIDLFKINRIAFLNLPFAISSRLLNKYLRVALLSKFNYK